MEKDRLLLLSNHSVLAAGLLALLEGAENLEVSAVAMDEPAVSDLIGYSNPDAILSDGECSSSLIAQLPERDPGGQDHPKSRGERPIIASS